MKLICDQCGAKYSIADEKVRGKVFKIRCKKCQNVIVVRGTDQPTAEGGQAITQQEEVPAPAAADAEPIWYVVVGREQVGPLTDADLGGRLAAGEVSGDSFVWQEGFSDWVQLRTVDRFAVQLGGAPPGAAAGVNGGAALGARGGAQAALEAAYGDDRSGGSDLDDEATQAVEHPPGGLSGYGGGGLGAVQAPRDEATAILDQGAAASLGRDGAAAGAASAGAPLGGAAGGGFANGSWTVEDGGAGPFDQSEPAASAFGGAIGLDLGRSAGADLLTSPAVVGGAANDRGGAMFSAFDGAQGQGAARNNEPGLVGARNENSVLFSLKNLQSLAMGQVDGKAGPAPPSTETQTDSSGLIDVRSLAGDARTGTPAAVREMSGDGLAGMSVAPVMIPMVRRRSNTPLIVGVALLAMLLVIAGTLGVAKVLSGGDAGKAAPGGKETAVATAVSAKAAAAEDVAPNGNPASAAADTAGPGDAAKEPPKPKTGKDLAARKAIAVKGPDSEEPPAPQAAASAPEERPAPREVARREPPRAEPPPKQIKTPKGGADRDLDSLLGGGAAKEEKPRKEAAPAPKPKREEPPPAGAAGKLGKSEIQGVVRANGDRISRCASRMPGPPGQKFRVDVRWEIQPNGRVTDAEVLDPKFASHPVGRCVLSAVKAMRFPSFGGKPIKIGKYPFGLKK